MILYLTRVIYIASAKKGVGVNGQKDHYNTMFQHHFIDSTAFEEDAGGDFVLRPLVDAAAAEETRVGRSTNESNPPQLQYL
jgi:hypothetical protein